MFIKLLRQNTELVRTCKLHCGFPCFGLLENYTVSIRSWDIFVILGEINFSALLIGMQYVSLSLFICEGGSNKVAKCARQISGILEILKDPPTEFPHYCNKMFASKIKK